MGRVNGLAVKSAAPGPPSRQRKRFIACHRHHDLVALVHRLDRRAHHPAIRLRARPVRFQHRDPHAQRVAGAHRRQPAQLVDPRRGQRRPAAPGSASTSTRMTSAGGVPAARDQAAERPASPRRRGRRGSAAGRSAAANSMMSASVIADRTERGGRAGRRSPRSGGLRPAPPGGARSSSRGTSL